jgi:hypothetical protein
MKLPCGLLAAGAVAALACGPPAPAPPAVTQVSGPFAHANLAVFLLHGPDAAPGLQVLTLQEAIEQKKVVVHETSEVNALSVENTGDAAVFIQSGDIVRGGKQDRSIAMDLLLPPKARVGVSSFCVEAGRWTPRGAEAAAYFNKSDNQIVGNRLKQAVNASRQQDEVWKEVREAQRKLAMNVGQPVADPASPSSLQLTLENPKVKEKVAAYETPLADLLKNKPGVVGVAVAVNGQVVGAEVYGSAGLCAKLWPKLLRSAAVDALAELDEKKKFEPATAKAVEAFLAEAAKAPGQEVDLAAAPRQPAASPAGQAGANPPAADAPPQQTQQRPAQQAANAPQRAEPQAGQPAAPPGTPLSPPAVRIVRHDGTRVLMIEAWDKARPGVILHRSYIAK